MSLSWDITKCTNIPRDPLPADHDGNEQTGPVTDEFWPVVNRMIWLTIAVGIGNLTAERAPEFYSRAKVWCRLNTEEPPTVEQVWRMIGLHTNVSYEAPTKWRKRILDYTQGNAETAYKRDIRALETPEVGIIG